MSKTISVALKAHYAQPLTTLSTCWRVTRLDGTTLGFTDHDKDSEFGGLVYRAATGYSATDVTTGNNLDVDNLEIDGVLVSPAITEDALRAGLWDHAEIKIFQVNWADLTMGALNLRIGHLGQVTIGRQGFKAELLGLMQAYQKSIGELTSPGCRANLGDSRCQVDLLAGSPMYTMTGTVGSYNETAMTLADSGRTEVSGFFEHGVLRFTSGLNAVGGIAFEIKTYVPGTLTLQLPPPYTVSPGDTYSVHAGCDKLLQTCITRFGNVVNFRGEPYLAGNDKLVQVGRHS